MHDAGMQVLRLSVVKASHCTQCARPTASQLAVMYRDVTPYQPHSRATEEWLHDRSFTWKNVTNFLSDPLMFFQSSTFNLNRCHSEFGPRADAPDEQIR